MSVSSQARWLHPEDDVATALADLKSGAAVRVETRGQSREIRLAEDIPSGHKFAIRPLASGLRVRKYGEFIGRLTAAAEAGAWIHVHNLATCALRNPLDADRHDGSSTLAVQETVSKTRAHVAESPVWDEVRKRLYWVDVRERPSIYMIEANGREQAWRMTEDIGSLVLAQDGRLIASQRSGLIIFDPETAAFTPIVDPEPQRRANRLNDSKCDPRGRLWFGSMNPDSGVADGSLYVLETDGTCRHVAGDLVTPNGHAWSLDGRTMYLSDTRRGYIYAYAFDVKTGDLGPGRIFADLGAFPGGPDGATTDSEGYLWSAQFNGGCLIRYAPSGAVDRVLRLPVSKPTSCAFGGDNYATLYVTTASRGLSESRLQGEPFAGHVLALDVGVRGLPPVRYSLSETLVQ